MYQHMPHRRPPLVTPLIGLAENVARTIRATPDERVRRLKLLAGATAAIVLIGWAAGVGAQTTSEPTPPPLPPAVQGDAAQADASPAQAPASQPDNPQPANTSQLGGQFPFAAARP